MVKRSASIDRLKAVMRFEHEYLVGEEGKETVRSVEGYQDFCDFQRPLTDEVVLDALINAVSSKGDNGKNIKFWYNILRLQFYFEMRNPREKGVTSLEAKDIHGSGLPFILKNFFEKHQIQLGLKKVEITPYRKEDGHVKIYLHRNANLTDSVETQSVATILNIKVRIRFTNQNHRHIDIVSQAERRDRLKRELKQTVVPLNVCYLLERCLRIFTNKELLTRYGTLLKEDQSLSMEDPDLREMKILADELLTISMEANQDHPFYDAMKLLSEITQKRLGPCPFGDNNFERVGSHSHYQFLRWILQYSILKADQERNGGNKKFYIKSIPGLKISTHDTQETFVSQQYNSQISSVTRNVNNSSQIRIHEERASQSDRNFSDSDPVSFHDPLEDEDESDFRIVLDETSENSPGFEESMNDSAFTLRNGGPSSFLQNQRERESTEEELFENISKDNNDYNDQSQSLDQIQDNSIFEFSRRPKRKCTIRKALRKTTKNGHYSATYEKSNVESESENEELNTPTTANDTLTDNEDEFYQNPSIFTTNTNEREFENDSYQLVKNLKINKKGKNRLFDSIQNKKEIEEESFMKQIDLCISKCDQIVGDSLEKGDNHNLLSLSCDDTNENPREILTKTEDDNDRKHFPPSKIQQIDGLYDSDDSEEEEIIFVKEVHTSNAQGGQSVIVID